MVGKLIVAEIRRRQVGRAIFRLQISPALKRPSRLAPGADDVRFEHDGASPDSVVAQPGIQIDYSLPRLNVSVDDPIQRSAVQHIANSLRAHSGKVEWRRISEASALPAFQIPNRAGADAEFNQIDSAFVLAWRTCRSPVFAQAHRLYRRMPATCSRWLRPGKTMPPGLIALISSASAKALTIASSAASTSSKQISSKTSSFRNSATGRCRASCIMGIGFATENAMHGAAGNVAARRPDSADSCCRPTILRELELIPTGSHSLSSDLLFGPEPVEGKLPFRQFGLVGTVRQFEFQVKYRSARCSDSRNGP